MKKEDIKRMVDRPEMIPGIHNYCDRWCEHCHFTERCSVFAIEDEEKEKSGELNVADHLTSIFNVVIEMIQEDAEKRGINLEELSGDSDDLIKEREELLEANYLVQLASKYPNLAHKLTTELELIEANLADDYRIADLAGLDKSQPLKLKDAFNAIRWYNFQIVAKIRRAVDGKESDDIFDEDKRDSDGSAKVALIGIERSIAAWQLIYESLNNDDILGVLGLLTRIRSQLLLDFPNAPNFKRPGFDD